MKEYEHHNTIQYVVYFFVVFVRVMFGMLQVATVSIPANTRVCLPVCEYKFSESGIIYRLALWKLAITEDQAFLVCLTAHRYLSWVQNRNQSHGRRAVAPLEIVIVVDGFPGNALISAWYKVGLIIQESFQTARPQGESHRIKEIPVRIFYHDFFESDFRLLLTFFYPKCKCLLEIKLLHLHIVESVYAFFSHDMFARSFLM